MNTMSRQVRRYRIKTGVSLDIPVGFRFVWEERMPNVVRLILEGNSYAEIAVIYKCKSQDVSNALRARHLTMRGIRHMYSKNVEIGYGF